MTGRQAENSDVLPLGSVAVAVMNRLTISAGETVTLKVALPLALVVVFAAPRNVSPSP